MLYSEIIAVCSQIHTKHINTVCGQNVELLNVILAVPLGYRSFYAASYLRRYIKELYLLRNAIRYTRKRSHSKPEAEEGNS
jgi:hypothetical protein